MLYTRSIQLMRLVAGGSDSEASVCCILWERHVQKAGWQTKRNLECTTRKAGCIARQL